MITKVRANCASIQPAAADAPTGSHQVLATKKYVLTRVISQIKTSNARPIPQSPPKDDTKGFPHGRCPAPQRKQQSAASVPQPRVKKSVAYLGKAGHGLTRISTDKTNQAREMDLCTYRVQERRAGASSHVCSV